MRVCSRQNLFFRFHGKESIWWKHKLILLKDLSSTFKFMIFESILCVQFNLHWNAKRNKISTFMKYADAVKRAQIHKWQSIRLKTLCDDRFKVSVFCMSGNISENRSQVTLIILNQCECVCVSPSIYSIFFLLCVSFRTVWQNAQTVVKKGAHVFIRFYFRCLLYLALNDVFGFLYASPCCVPCLCSSIVVVATECVQHILILNINW